MRHRKFNSIRPGAADDEADARESQTRRNAKPVARIVVTLSAHEATVGLAAGDAQVTLTAPDQE